MCQKWIIQKRNSFSLISKVLKKIEKKHVGNNSKKKNRNPKMASKTGCLKSKKIP